MTLAGNMKLRTFVVVATLVVVGGVTTSYFACKGSKSSEQAKTASKSEATTAPVIHVPDAASPSPDASVATTTTGADLAARPYDADVLAWRGKTVANGKGKDVSKGHPWKINVYADGGSTVTRAKVDANRNNKWDDKYTFKGDEIVLEHAPADDEVYTQTFVWNGSGWNMQR